MIALLVVATCSAMAQSAKKDSTLKKEPQVKITYPGVPAEKIITLQISVPAGQLGNFSFVNGAGGEEAIGYSQNISALQATLMKKDYKSIIDSVNKKWGNYMQADMLRWAADTAKKVMPHK